MNVSLPEHLVKAFQGLGGFGEKRDSAYRAVQPVWNTQENLTRLAVPLGNKGLERFAQGFVTGLVPLDNLARTLVENDQVVVFIEDSVLQVPEFLWFHFSVYTHSAAKIHFFPMNFGRNLVAWKIIISFALMKRIISLLASAALLSACGTLFGSDPALDKRPSQEVVDIGYGTEVRENLTTSISSVPIDDKMPMPYRDIYELIEGKCPGVVVEGKSITIRGKNSINSGTEPLILVDGNPQSNIDWVNPNDVKSIDVLKDAGSTAIYGSRGANGVILINLK